MTSATTTDPASALTVLFGTAEGTAVPLVALPDAVSANLGSRLSAWLNDRLMRACTQPRGLAHLERPELAKDLSVARDFDLGIMGPPLFIAMDFIAGGLLELVAGMATGPAPLSPVGAGPVS